MSQYILDTDHVTLLQQLHPVVRQHVNTVNLQNIGLTVVTVEEQMRGWLNAIRQASQSSSANRLIWAYVGLRDSLNFLNNFELINFSLEAYILYTELRRQRIRIGTQDLKIAAIALSTNSILITRNQRDFSQVPSLLFADWTVQL